MEREGAKGLRLRSPSSSLKSKEVVMNGALAAGTLEPWALVSTHPIALPLQNGGEELTCISFPVPLDL